MKSQAVVGIFDGTTKVVNNIGGKILATDSIDLSAGWEINIVSGTNTSTNTGGKRVALDESKIASVVVTSTDGSMNMSAGQDVNINSALVINAGDTDIAAGRDINIGTVEVSEEYHVSSGGNSNSHQKVTDSGSVLSLTGDTSMRAGNDINLKATTIDATGDVSLNAGNDINITEGRNYVYDEAHTSGSSGGFLSKKRETWDSTYMEDKAIGSDISAGGSISINAGNDVNVRGSNVVAQDDLSVYAGNDINITTAENYKETYTQHVGKKSGVFGGYANGTLTVGVGVRESGKEKSSQAETKTGSVLGSTGGNVDMYAGGDFYMKGSTIGANTGDVSISGENVTIEHDYNVTDTYSKTWSSQTGLSLTASLNGKVGDIVKSTHAIDTAHMAAKKASTHETKTLQDIITGAHAAQIASNSKSIVDNVNDKGWKDGLSADTGLNLGLSIGTQKKEEIKTTHSEKVVGSTIGSGGNTSITARGNGEEGSGDLNIIGSTVDAGGWVDLDAANDINLISADEIVESHTRKKESSASLGVNVGLGGYGAKNSISKLELEAKYGTGHTTSDTSSLTHVETVINGGEGVRFNSRNDNTMIGAQIRGDRVEGKVGGDLNIISEQDLESQDFSSQTNSFNAGIGVKYGPNAGIISGGYTGLYGKGKGKGNYASVKEQSGIFAGDGGFDIKVGGNTHLKGAVIDSDADSSKNRLETGSLTTEDILNQADYSASSGGWSLGVTVPKDKKSSKGKENVTGSPSIHQSESNSSSSITKSGIADGEIVITDPDAQMERTGQTPEEIVENLNRDTKNAHDGPLPSNPNVEKLVSGQQALAKLVQSASKEVSSAVTSISGHIQKEIGESNAELAAKFDKDGTYTQILTAVGTVLSTQIGTEQGLEAALGLLAGYLASGNTDDFAKKTGELLGNGNPIQTALWTNTITNVIVKGSSTLIGGSTGGSVGKEWKQPEEKKKIRKTKWGRL